MKLSRVENQAQYRRQNLEENAKSTNNKQHYVSAPASPTSFKGGVDMLVKFWEGVDRGGLAASFTVQDMLGTNIPRTVSARNVGKEYTGKNNWSAVAENGLREFLTGPSMFAVPAAVLYGTMHAAGKSHGVPVESIKDFAQLAKDMKGTQLSSLEEFRKEFYKKVLDSTFNTINPKSSVETASYVDDILKMEKAQKKGLFKNIMGKSIPDSKEELLQGIVKRFVEDKKANTTGYPDFLSAKIKDGSKEIDFEKILDRMNKFSDDLFNTLKKDKLTSIPDNYIENFAKKRMGGRFVVNIAMGVFTAAAMWFIPKIYSIGKTNPETAPLKEWSSDLQSQMQGGSSAIQNNTALNKDAKQDAAPAQEAPKEVAFSGGGISKLVSDIGEKVSPAANSKLSNLAPKLESDWINVARPIFLSLITGFTLVPRVIQSAKRDIQTNKEKNTPNDWSETKNILRRDVTTIITILFAMKGLGSIMAHSASKKTGVILTNKILDDKINPFRKFVEFFNPEGGVKVLSKKQNAAQMSSFTNGDELARFLEDTNSKGGNLYKLFHIDAKPKKGQESALYNAALNLFGKDKIDNKDLKVADLTNTLRNIKPNGEKYNELQELLSVLNDQKKNPLLKFANKINAIFETVSLAIVTGFLGFGLPKINDHINKKNEIKKLNKIKKQSNNTTVEIPKLKILNNLKPQEKQVYQYFLGNVK